MNDVLSSVQRSYCMSRIQGRNTKPEILLRRALWKVGYRYRLKTKVLGRPDLVFLGKKVAVFVDGCFWHGCPEHYSAPKSRADFWAEKLKKTKGRDAFVNERLADDGWVVIRIWEHDLKNNLEGCVNYVSSVLSGR